MADQDASSKTEKATPEKRKKAREQGQFARSKDGGAVAASIAVLLILSTMGPYMVRQVFAYTTWCLSGPQGLYEGMGAIVVHRSVMLLVLLIFPCAFGAALLAQIIGFAQAGWHPHSELMLPKWDRLEPLSKLKGLFFSANSLLEIALSIVRLAIVGAVAYSTLRPMIPTLTHLSSCSLQEGAGKLMEAASQLTLRATIALAVLAVLDYAQNWIRLEKQLMMSRQEIKEEMRQQEGDPQIRGRLRGKMREMAKRSIAKQVAQSDVVVANPTHISVALQYREDQSAPVVTAKGYDEMALHIRALARQSGIPVVENRFLARALAAKVKVGKPIPLELYAAVAELLAFVYRLKKNPSGNSS